METMGQNLYHKIGKISTQSHAFKVKLTNHHKKRLGIKLTEGG